MRTEIEPEIELLADDLWFRLHHGVRKAAKICRSQMYNGDYYSESTDAHDGGVRCCVSAIEGLLK